MVSPSSAKPPVGLPRTRPAPHRLLKSVSTPVRLAKASKLPRLYAAVHLPTCRLRSRLPARGLSACRAACLQEPRGAPRPALPRDPRTRGPRQPRLLQLSHPLRAASRLRSRSQGCRPLLAAAAGRRHGAGPAARRRKAKPGRVVPLQPTGGLTLNQIKHSCLVQDDPQSTDEKSIAALVENARHIAGLHPIAHTLSYEIPGASVLFAASSGPTADEKGHRTPSAGLTYTGTAGILAGTRLFLVSFTANDLATFNGMLAAKICLDAPACASGYGTLVPYRLTPQGEVQPISQ